MVHSYEMKPGIFNANGQVKNFNSREDKATSQRFGQCKEFVIKGTLDKA